MGLRKGQKEPLNLVNCCSVYKKYWKILSKKLKIKKTLSERKMIEIILNFQR